MDEQLLVETKKLLAENKVKRVSHFQDLDVKHIRFEDAPAAATLGMFVCSSVFDMLVLSLQCRFHQ